MTAKESLKKIGRMELFIQTKKERLAVLKDMKNSISSPRYDGMPRSREKGRSKLEESVLKYIDLEDEIIEDEKSLEHQKLLLLEAIGNIEEPEYQTVLIQRYFNYKSWDEIANSLFYTKRWLYTLHGKALRKLDEILKEF